MSDMVDRVAAAIYEQQHGVLYDLATPSEVVATREIARAAIRAIREPSDDDWQLLLSAAERLRGGGTDPDAPFRIAFALEQLARRINGSLDDTRKSP